MLADKEKMGFSYPEDRLESSSIHEDIPRPLVILTKFAEKLNIMLAEGCMTIRWRKLRASAQAKMGRTDSAPS